MARTDYPRGKGLFLWQIRMVQPLYPADEDAILAAKEDGAPMTRNAGINVLNNLKKILPQSAETSLIVKGALDLGLSWVAIKVSNGIYKYNQRWTGVKYVDDILPPLVEEFQRAGIKVIGWHYIYGYAGYAKRYAQQAIDRAKQLNLDGFMVNAEKEYKDNPAEARLYAEALRAGLPDMSIGLSSYRYPSYHSNFPFWEFVRYFDYHSPQVYWLGAHNPKWQLEKSIGELKAIRDLPIIPAGLAYAEGRYAPPSVAEMDEFHQAVLDNNLPGYLWWEWWRASLIGRLGTLGAHVWPGSTPPTIPPETPTEPIKFPLLDFDGQAQTSTKGIQDNRDAINQIAEVVYDDE